MYKFKYFQKENLRVIIDFGKNLKHTAKENALSIVNASFHVTHWSVQPFGTGVSRMKYVGKQNSWNSLNLN